MTASKKPQHLTDSIDFSTKNWCHISETLSMLSLAIAQINMSMTEGDHSVNTLTKSFVSLVEDIRIILDELKQDISSHSIETIQATVDKIANDICNRVNDGIIAFQFYDRLSQRLDHISQSLDGVSGIISEPQKRNHPEEWRNLQKKIRLKYSMEAERKMFDAIMSGKKITEALTMYKQDQSFQEGDVELF